jgi:hypothetical protein
VICRFIAEEDFPMKMSAVYAVALCLLLAAPAARAEEAAAAGNKLTVKVDPALQKREAAYKAALKALTPEQQATLKSAEDDFMKTVTPGIQFLATSAQLDACKAKAGSPIAKESKKYDSEVKVLRSQILAAQAEERAQLHEQRGKQITFIDQKLVDDHLVLLAQITEGVGKGMVQTTIDKGGFDNTDCAEVAQTMDAVFAPAKAGDKATDAGKAAEPQKKADAEKTQ